MHLVVIGLMGVGKTTVGRRVAALLDRPFVDSDHHIEATTGRTVKQILTDDGVEVLRTVEAAALFDAVDAPMPSVIGCAAGVVLDPANVDRINAARDEGALRVVWLTGDPAVLAPRTQSRGHRPWLDDDPAATLARMHAERGPLYEQIADLTVDVTPDGAEGNPDLTAAEIVEWLV
ncbi:MAG TPA: shikimate kinase [Ilumatobacter sp.]|nr:shikimate kinase [Ilumatobacter sp.]